MRHSYLLLLALLLCTAHASAQRVLDIASGVFTSTPAATGVGRSVTPTDNGYTVRYVFNSATLVPDASAPGAELWLLDGFTPNITEGEPAYPYSSDSFYVEGDGGATITLTDVEWLTVSSLCAPAQPPVLFTNTELGNPSPVTSAITSVADGWFPCEPVVENPSRMYRDTEIVNIGICPVQFDQSTGEARVAKMLEYSVAFNVPGNKTMDALRSSSTISMYDSGTLDEYLDLVTLNKQDQSNSMQRLGTIDRPLPVRKYLIIAPTEYKPAVEDFADWKRTLGFETICSYAKSWSVAEIQEEIAAHENLYALLLVGNNAQVPGQQIYSPAGGVNFKPISDIPYACTDDKDYIPDFSIGRLPVNNLQEASLVLRNIEQYERSPMSKANTYTSDLFLSDFIDNGKTPSTAIRRNAQTTYEISDYLSTQARQPELLLKADPNVDPAYWGEPGIDDKGNLVYPCPVPEALRRPHYNWSVSTEKILLRLNKGYGQVFYYGHGDNEAWLSPALPTNVLNKANTSGISPIIFSMACLTGNFSHQGCLMERLMTTPTIGAVGAFAFTDLTHIVHTDVVAFSLFNSMYPSPGIKSVIMDEDNITVVPGPKPYTGTRQLGMMHRRAITDYYDRFPDTRRAIEHKTHQALITTLLGDPTMLIRIEAPQLYQPIISSKDGTAVVSVDDSRYIITIRNKRTGEISNYLLKAVVPLTSNIKDFEVCVHGEGIIPYVENLSVLSPVLGKPERSTNYNFAEGQRWTYHKTADRYSPYTDVYINLTLDGRTEIDGKEYLDCKVWRADKDYTEDNTVMLAHFREENGKVYVRYEPDAPELADEKEMSVMPYSPMMSTLIYDLNELSQHDLLLYDFNLGVGDSLQSWPWSDESPMYEVTGMEEVTYENHTFNSWLLNTARYDSYNNYYEAVETIGTRDGLLPYPNATTEWWSESDWRLKEVIAADGSALYRAAGFSGMHKPTAEAVDKIRYLDLSGCEIDAPVSGQPCIRVTVSADGQIRTEKIMAH